MITLQNLLTHSPPETLPITAIIDTALCVGAGGSSGSLADKPIVRTANGNLLIPASQIKGRLRHECEKIARGLGWAVCQSPTPQTMCPQRAGFSADEEQSFHHDAYAVPGYLGHHCIICQIFGNPTLPSRLIVNDFICSETANIAEVIRPGVTLNRRRRTAEDAKLYFLETSPANLQLPFHGSITLSPDSPPYTLPLLKAAFAHIHALGGSKSAGLGWLHWEFSNWVIEDAAWSALLPGGEQ